MEPKNGLEVTITKESIKRGYVLDQILAEKHLLSGNTYTIKTHASVSPTSTWVILEEAPGIAFNFIIFECDLKQNK